MDFNDFAAGLASTLSLKNEDKFYDFHISELKEMQPYERRAHISSMKHSQRHDYGCGLRVVITDNDVLKPGADPWSVDSYTTPDLDYAIQQADQVVIRRDGGEKLVKSRN